MSAPRSVAFVSGHMDLTEDEFNVRYRPAIVAAVEAGSVSFVVGDAPGCDIMAQRLFKELGVHPSQVVVHHMSTQPRCSSTKSATLR